MFVQMLTIVEEMGAKDPGDVLKSVEFKQYDDQQLEAYSVFKIVKGVPGTVISKDVSKNSLRAAKDTIPSSYHSFIPFLYP